MDRTISMLTVCFQPPFWVGLAERWGADGYQVARTVFGAEPTDAQLYQWVLREWHRLEFTAPAPGQRPQHARVNPKRARREAQAAVKARGGSTKAQEALSRQREQQSRAHRAELCRRHQERQAEQFQLRQQKKREKRRGH